jgi:cellulose synthase operon protein C
MRKLNLIFLMSMVMALLLVGGGAYLVHGRQVQQNASALLNRARKDEVQNNGSKAAATLRHYLSLRPRDGEAWRWYARLLDEVTTDIRRRDQVYLVSEEALRYNPGDPALERRCVDLALELRPGRTADAKRHLKILLTQATEKLEKGIDVSNAAMELAELKELEGRCLFMESDCEAAANAYREAITYDPTRLLSYVQRARLDRNELHKEPKDADDEIDWMVANNPESGLAHLYRFRYSTEFRPPAAESDLKKALELSPENHEVLLTAALVAEQKKDSAAARSYLEKGLRLHPQNGGFPMTLARLELGEQHPDRAESVLRRAYQDRPSVDLAFLLAEILILEDKVDGEDGASGLMKFLGDRGYRETYVRYLEARIEVKAKRWDQAISKLESALAVMKADQRISMQLNLMLAECYTGLGWEEKRLEALRNAGESPAGSEVARLALAGASAQSGKVDKALAILVPLVDGKPELKLDLVRLLIQKTIRQPGHQRNWQEVERYLSEAEKSLPQAIEPLTLLRLDMLAARGRLENARSLLAAAQAKDPRNLQYRLALARLSQRQGKGPSTLQILDQAEKDLGPSREIQLARLDYWRLQGGEAAKAPVAKLAETRQQIPTTDRPAFLDRLALTEIRLHELGLARQYWRELATLQLDNIRVRLGLFDLAVETGDRDAANDLVSEIRKIEGEKGTSWRFAQAALLIDTVRRGVSHDMEPARVLAAEISERRPDWWAGPSLNGELAELAGSPDLAIEQYLRAVELGNVQPSFARRLVGLLHQRNRFNDIDRVAQVLGEQGIALDEITLVKAIDTIRKQNFDDGIALARQIFPATSTKPSDHLTLGRFYVSAGRSDAAGKEFRRAVELGPGVPDSWLTYVEYLVQAKQIDQARTAIEAAGKALPADRATLTLAQCWMSVGDLMRAEELIGKAFNDEGKSADQNALKIAAILALGQNRLDKADEFLNKLDRVANLSASDKAWVNRIRISLLLKKGRLPDQDQALGLVEQNLRNDPNSIEDQQLKATMLALRPGRRAEAVKILEQLDSANPLAAKERFLLAQLYLGQSEDPKYQDEMFKLLKLKVRNPQHLAHFVNFWIGCNQLNQADRWLAELKKADPQGSAVLELEARLLDLRKRKPELLALLKTRWRQVPDQIGLVADLLNRYGFVKEAETAHKTFIARDPKQPQRTLPLAVFLAGQDRVDEAMEILKKARSTCRPEQVAEVALLVLDAPSATETQRRHAEAWLEEAVRKGPDSIILASRLGVLRIRQGRFDEAEGLFRRLMASDPNDPDVLNNLAWLLALRDPDKAQEALGLINRGIEIRGPMPSLLDTRAVVLIRSGQPVRAVQDLTRAQELSPGNPSPSLHLAWAYQTNGDLDQARRAFRKAVDLGWKVANSDPLEHKLMEKMRRDLGIAGN